jgi:hypothetical protein
MPCCYLLVKAVESGEASVTGSRVSTGEERGRGRRRPNHRHRRSRQSTYNRIRDFHFRGPANYQPSATIAQQYDAFMQYVVNGCAAERPQVRAQPQCNGASIGLGRTIYQNVTGVESATTMERNGHTEQHQIIGHVAGLREEPFPPAQASIATPETPGAPSPPHTTTPATSN